MIEIVSPAGFANYFQEVADAGGDSAKLAHINGKYSIYTDLESIGRLCERFGLTFPLYPGTKLTVAAPLTHSRAAESLIAAAPFWRRFGKSGKLRLIVERTRKDF